MAAPKGALAGPGMHAGQLRVDTAREQVGLAHAKSAGQFVAKELAAMMERVESIRMSHQRKG